MSDRYYSPDQDLHFKLTTEAEERSLFLQARAGDEIAREFLIHNHLLFAATTARRMVKGRLPEDEVISAANAALMNAFEKFDPNYGTRFTTYLRPFIRGAICQLWRSKNPVRYGDQFPDADAEHVHVFDKVVAVEGFEQTIYPDHEAVDEKRFLLARIEDFRDELNDKERELLRLAYQEELSFAEIGRQRGVTRAAIQAAHRKVIVKLRGMFEQEDIAA